MSTARDSSCVVVVALTDWPPPVVPALFPGRFRLVPVKSRTPVPVRGSDLTGQNLILFRLMEPLC